MKKYQFLVSYSAPVIRNGERTDWMHGVWIITLRRALISQGAMAGIMYDIKKQNRDFEIGGIIIDNIQRLPIGGAR